MADATHPDAFASRTRESAGSSADPTALAESVRSEIGTDIVSVALSYPEERVPLTWAHAVSDEASSLAPLLDCAIADPIGLTTAAIRTMGPIRWERLGEEALFTQSVAELYAAEPQAAGSGRMLADAIGAAVPIGPSSQPRGAVAAVDLARVRSSGAIFEALFRVVPRLSLRAREGALIAQLRLERATANALAQSSESAALVWDAEGRLLRTTGPLEGVFGVSLGPEATRSSRAAVVGMLRAAFADPIEASGNFLASGGGGVEQSWRARTVSGRLLEITSSPLRDDDGRTRGTIDVVVDAGPAPSEAPAREARGVGDPDPGADDDHLALSQAAHALASGLTRAQVYETLLVEALGLVPSDKAAVLALNTRGDLLPVATTGFAEPTVERMLFRTGEGLAGSAIQSRQAQICDDTDTDPRIAGKIARAEGIRSFIHVPIVLGERTHGLLTLHSSRIGRYGPRELHVLEELALHSAAALQNAAQYEHERYVAETLQESLLAHDLPKVPGLELAALYRPSQGAAVGGDLYNVWLLPDGHVAVLVGDVSGKGVDAAGTTAMVRYMAEAFSHREGDPGRLLCDLNRALFERTDDVSIVTAVLIVIDPKSHEMRWAIAGHPPPLLVDSENRVSSLDDPDPPCGAFVDSHYRTRTARLDPGSLLFAYTDGLSEARRDGREFGEAGVRAAVTESIDAPVGTLARSVHAAARVWSGGRVADDVAIAVVKATAE